jgi:hypothetical protein
MTVNGRSRVAPEGASFYTAVFRAELKEISMRRQHRGIERTVLEGAVEAASEKLQLAPRSELGLTGLALSGGGIRSATFNLGLLQGMANIRNELRPDNTLPDKTLLSLFDYLSTVSGGGYIGAWLSAWIRRDGPAAVEDELRGKPRLVICEDDESPDAPEIKHLRKFGNYLTPTIGLLSSDTWTVIAAYVRNALVNQAVLIPLLAGLLLVPRLLAAFVEAPGLAVFIPAFILTAVAMWCASYVASRPTVPFTKKHLWWLIIAPLVVAAFLLLTWWKIPDSPNKAAPHSLPWIIAWVGGWTSAFIAINLVGWALYASAGKSDAARERPGWALVAWLVGAVVGAVSGGFLFQEIFEAIGPKYWARSPWHLVVWGPTIALILFVITWNIQLGIRGKYESDMSREWWATMTGLVLAFAASWFLVAVISIYGPLLFQLLKDWVITKYTLVAGWIFATLGAILAGRSPKSGELESSSLMDLVAKTLAPIATIGLLIAVAIGLHVTLGDMDGQPPDATSLCQDETSGRSSSRCVVVDRAGTLTCGEAGQETTFCTTIKEYWARFNGVVPHNTMMRSNNKAEHIRHVGGLLVLCLIVAGIMGLAVDVNQFSMHAVYRNRLIRCYLRAIRRNGKPGDITDLDPDDDLPLSSLVPSADKIETSQPKKRGLYPYLLINTALNITKTNRLAWQERKAVAFLLAPLYCGSNLTGYRRTRDYAGKHDEGISLGTAFTISGAAFTSSMGYHTSRALAFFLSIFNVRLGWWIGNPGGTQYGRQGPRWGLFYLLVELFGWANAEREYIYLSDGGHFDNLGLYELVRRRCKYIVCSDAGEDPEFAFNDLGMAIRKIRADFGLDIEINLDMVKRAKDQPYSRWHHAIGTIRYDQVDENSPVGVLVYVKASLVGDEPADVLEYKAAHKKFPHETTLDQFFSESQFEAYRRLGEHIGREVFRYAQQAL